MALHSVDYFNDFNPLRSNVKFVFELPHQAAIRGGQMQAALYRLTGV
jgi:hypothetical protein